MPDLIAQGPTSADRWRRELPDPSSGIEILLGRADSDWNVPWDTMISRRHVRIVPQPEGRIEVTRYPTARNPVFHRGANAERFTVVPGDHFVIGHTTFTLANRPGASESHGPDVTTHSYDPVALRKRNFRDAASRIEMLSRLPDLIAGSGSDEELLVRVAGVLLQATPAASAVAIVAFGETPFVESAVGESAVGESAVGESAVGESAVGESAGDESPGDGPSGDGSAGDGSAGDGSAVDGSAGDGAPGNQDDVRVLHYDSRGFETAGPSISARLVRSAVTRQESILHLWAGGRREGADYTMSEDVDWAFCAPLRNEACPGWALYVTGQLPPSSDGDLEMSLRAAPDDLEDDVKFAELVGLTVANLRQSRRLERRQSAMRRFFAPVVLDALAGRDTDQVLAPRETTLSVLFCDLRGFTRQSEQDAGQLLDLLARVSDALGVMTRHILETGGVIGDFHGDAAMGFWGWPLEQNDMAARAAETAIRIRNDYGADPERTGFRCGIGIASGLAVAGRIGTVDQVKVTAFGPVVNLASRLEGITKAFGAEVIVDESTALSLRQASPEAFPYRLRRLARVRPAGMTSAVEVSQLLLPDDGSPHSLTDGQVADYEKSLNALNRGDWNEAYEGLHSLPAWDRPKDRLISTILTHNRVPPKTWEGVIDLPKL